MKCRYCETRPRPCRRFMVAPDRPRDVCAKCHEKVEKAAVRFVEAMAPEEVRS